MADSTILRLLSYAKIVQTERHESNFNGRGAAYLMQN